jgi:K+-sensing histidine kinase KdpD
LSGFDDQNQMVWLSITDSGAGIDPADLPRIFEPFYSTKTEGKGVGLGLSMVYGIIRAHNGTIEVDSEMGRGSTFRIRLPRLSKQSQHTEHGQQCQSNGMSKALMHFTALITSARLQTHRSLAME